jgi:hypothetical protein
VHGHDHPPFDVVAVATGPSLFVSDSHREKEPPGSIR